MSAKPSREAEQATPQSRAGEPPRRERRSRHRVRDEQGTGQGSMTALSKLKMLERHRAEITPRRSDEF